jgi:hypothetical protein
MSIVSTLPFQCVWFDKRESKDLEPEEGEKIIKIGTNHTAHVKVIKCRLPEGEKNTNKNG